MRFNTLYELTKQYNLWCINVSLYLKETKKLIYLFGICERYIKNIYFIYFPFFFIFWLCTYNIHMSMSTHYWSESFLFCFHRYSLMRLTSFMFVFMCQRKTKQTKTNWKHTFTDIQIFTIFFFLFYFIESICCKCRSIYL